jgi:putative ABC transport system permease protein
MQKVGMSQSEVKSTIRSQILLVFFLPLLVAAVHIAFAFPILTKLLRALFHAEQLLFLGCTVGALVVFAVLYVAIYSMTARTYYKIVRRE